MATQEPSLTIGLEEEYFLVDPATGALVAEPPPELLAECERRLDGRAGPEFLRAQIEVQTGVCRTVGEARADLAHKRRTVAEVAAKFGLVPIACSTHPSARWEDQRPTPRERYASLGHDLQAVGRRLVICGLHVHAGVEDQELRIDLMNQVAYFLPHLLALSTSSPFWRGEETGLKSYRMSVFSGIPRTGPPDYFESWGDYQRLLNRLVDARLISDASKLWWDVRPSAWFPTLEMRITDVPTRLDDAIAIAALYQGLLSMLWRLRRDNQRWRIYPHLLVKENRWRAQRYGSDEGLVDFGKGEIVPYAHLLEEIIALIRPDTERLGSVAEAESARGILARGTSAHRQIAVFRDASARGATRAEGLKAVIDWLAAETLAGL